MEKISYNDEIWKLANSTETTVELQETGEEEGEEEDETLSLSDLPLIHQWRKEEEEEEEDENNGPKTEKQTQDDFDFCSTSKESSEKMCIADEVFFQGQIVPLRHSVSTRPISRSESMDHFHSGSVGLITSRSSSISSHQSSSSGSSSATIGPRPKSLPPRNQFHSHPSPSPKLRVPKNTNQNYRNINCTKKTSIWDVFQLGLLTPPPKVAFQDTNLKRYQSNNKSSNCTNFGSRKSSDSNTSSVSSKRSKKNISLLFGGCKCSADAVDTVRSGAVVIKRSASESDVDALELKKPEDSMKPAKKQLSHHRTFEWLKQLSIEGGSVDEEA